MNLVWKFIKSMRWFFISAVIIFFMAFGLSHLSASGLGGSFSDFVINHQYLWLFFRSILILIFFFVWPALVNGWAKKYEWSVEYTIEVKKRRWRYVVWFIVIDLAFQLL